MSFSNSLGEENSNSIEFQASGKHAQNKNKLRFLSDRYSKVLRAIYFAFLNKLR